MKIFALTLAGIIAPLTAASTDSTPRTIARYGGAAAAAAGLTSVLFKLDALRTARHELTRALADGNAELIQKAQESITNASWGLKLSIAILTVGSVLAGASYYYPENTTPQTLPEKRGITPKAADDHATTAAASASAGAAAPAAAISDPFTGYADPNYAKRLHIVPPERRITPDAIHDPDILEAIFLGLRNNDTFSCNYIARHLGYPEGTRTIFNSPITGKSFWITQAWLRINANVRASGDPRLRTDHPVSGGYRLLFFILRFVHGVPLEHLQALVAKIKATDIPTTFLRPEIQALGLGDATGHMELALWCIEYLDAIPATDGEARNMAMLEVFSPLLSDLNNRKAYPVKTDSYSHCF